MDDATVMTIIMIIGNLNVLLALIVGVKKRSVLWGIATLFLAPMVLLLLFVGALATGSRSMPNPQRFNRY